MEKSLAIILILITAISCKKPSKVLDTDPLPATRIRLNTSRQLNTNGHFILMTRTYNDTGLLTKVISKDETSGIDISQEFQYNDNQLQFSVTSTANRAVSKIKYSYADDKLINMDYLEVDQQGNEDLTFSRRFEYYDSNVKKISTFSKQQKMLYYERFVFDGDKNLTQATIYSKNGVEQYKTEYLYDRKLNPYIGSPDYNQSAQGFSRNNIIRIKRTDYLNPAADSEIQFVYTYNTDHYPIESSIKEQGKPQNKSTFTYQKY